jgi:hypothetical protein
MLMVASELATGCILTPEIGAMYGPNNTSEAAQSERIVDRLPGNALVLADCAFGIFRVAYRCHSLGKEFVFRLTSDRFRSYQKKSTLVESGPGFSTWRFQWSPSLKELLGSVIAYNLVTQFRRQAAKLAKITPRRLSFKGVWLSFTYHLLYARAETLAEWEKNIHDRIDQCIEAPSSQATSATQLPACCPPSSPQNHRGPEGAVQKQTTNTRLMMKSRWHWANAPRLIRESAGTR